MGKHSVRVEKGPKIEEVEEKKIKAKKAKKDRIDEENDGVTSKKTKKKKEGNKMKNGKKKHGLLKALLIFLLIIIIICGVLAGLAWWYLNDKLDKVQYENVDRTAIGITEEVKEELSGYRNIAILGIDSRADDYSPGNRSDCIIIASIDRKTNNVKLCSIYRDTYLQMENQQGKEIIDKATHAYAYGGAQNALKMLNTNLDLNIEEVVTVNFDAVVTAVDAIGGIDLYIDSEEVKYINQYIRENNKVTHHNSSTITKAGTYHVDGVQALAYARIRYTAGGDYKRTERMRNVIDLMAKKAKTLSVSQLDSVADTVLPLIRTNIAKNEIIGMIPKITSFNIVESIGWPYNIQGATIGGVWYGVPVTLESNVTELHKKLFGQEDYVASDRVKEINKKITTKSGYSK